MNINSFKLPSTLVFRSYSFIMNIPGPAGNMVVQKRVDDDVSKEEEGEIEEQSCGYVLAHFLCRLFADFLVFVGCIA